MIRPLTVREVLDAVGPDVPLTPETESRVREALRPLVAATPWYLRTLMGVGAWVGTWFLLAFVLGVIALAFDGQVEGAAIVIGVGLVAGALALRRSASGDFPRQLALVVSLTGQGLLVGGIGSATNSLEAASIAGLLVSAVLLAVFPDRVHRFVSTVAAVAALMALVFEWHVPHGGEAVALILMAVAVGLWRAAPARWRTEYAGLVHPIVSGVIVSLLGLLLLASVLRFLELNPPSALAQGAPTTVGAVLGLLWLVWEVFGDWQADSGSLDLVGVTVVIGLLATLTSRTPAIATTLLVILLAFDRRNRTIMALAVVFFLAFGALYYYNLELTLLHKSGVLVGSGLLCLVGCGVVRLRSAGESS